MIKKIIFILSIFLIFPAQAKMINNLILNSKILGEEKIEIIKTPLSDKDLLEELKLEISLKEKYLNKINPILVRKNMNRPPLTKFKGSEEIYKEYANSVVFIGNKNNSGSGFVIDFKGKKIITNWHVIEGSKKVKIWLKPKDLVDERYMIGNQESFNAKVIKIDKEKDLALLDVSGLPNNIKPVALGKFENISIGETVFAIGHPGELIWTFSSGMVSQLRPNYKWKYRNSNHFANVIQTQTPINPGNSGGPLFNKDKKLVGVNTFTTEGENLNFAVSVDDLIEFLEKPEKKIQESPWIKKKKKPTWITKKDKKTKKKEDGIYKKYPNAKKIDADKNGITDAWFIDENKNGKIDRAYIDFNEDGIIEAVAFDENENSNFEIFVFDDDLDGNANRAELDIDDDGDIDEIAYDYDQDGVWDKFDKV